MHVTLFRALRSANIAEDAAEKVVHAFEEHIDMAVAEAMKHYDDRITAMQTVLETKLDTGLKNIEARFAGFEGKLTGMQTSIDVLKWAIIAQGTILMIVGVATGFIKLIH
jgi:hypothetical protein